MRKTMFHLATLDLIPNLDIAADKSLMTVAMAEIIARQGHVLGSFGKVSIV